MLGLFLIASCTRRDESKAGSRADCALYNQTPQACVAEGIAIVRYVTARNSYEVHPGPCYRGSERFGSEDHHHIAHAGEHGIGYRAFGRGYPTRRESHSNCTSTDTDDPSILLKIPLGVTEQKGLTMVLKACDNGVCTGAAVAGIPATIVYNGPFNPQLDILHPENGFHESFTVTIPEGVSGPSILGVIHYLSEDVGAVLILTFVIVIRECPQLADTPLIEFTGVSFNVQ